MLRSRTQDVGDHHRFPTNHVRARPHRHDRATVMTMTGHHGLLPKVALVVCAALLTASCAQENDDWQPGGDLILATIATTSTDRTSDPEVHGEGTLIVRGGCVGIERQGEHGTMVNVAVFFADATSVREKNSGALGVRITQDQVLRIGKSYSGSMLTLEPGALSQVKNSDTCAKALDATEGLLIYTAEPQETPEPQ